MTDSDRRTFLTATAAGAAAFAIQPRILARRPPSSARLRVGLVGSGRQGRAILGELAKLDEVEVVALCDTNPSRLRSGLRRAQGAQGFEAHRALLDEAKPDALVVATPTHLHRDVAVEALQAGAHVYCEAPLAHRAEDAGAIVAAARDAKGVFASGLQARTNPIYRLARSFFRSGAIRDRLVVRAQYRKKTSWRSPASDAAAEKALNWKLDPDVSLGLAGEMGTHQFDVVHWFTGRYPTGVRGTGSIRAWEDGREVADTVACDLSFDDGLRLHWDATLGNSYEGTHELFVGTMGSIKLAWTAGWMFKEADAPTQGWEVYANRQQFHNDEGITLIADATKLASQGKLKEGVGLPDPPLYYALESFLASALDGDDVACTAEEGLRATLVGIAAHRAAVTGEDVAIELEER